MQIIKGPLGLWNFPILNKMISGWEPSSVWSLGRTWEQAEKSFFSNPFYKDCTLEWDEGSRMYWVYRDNVLIGKIWESPETGWWYSPYYILRD